MSSTQDGGQQLVAPEPPDPIERRYAQAQIRETVRTNHLSPMGLRPPLGDYLRKLWDRRSFIRVLSSSKAYAQNQNSYLGQTWAVLTPVLNAAVYVLIFGFLLQVAREGIENTVAFIVVGTFMFRFFELSIFAGSRSIRLNMNLVRSVKFPRAVMPISAVLAELTVLGPALVVMIVISYLSGLLPFEGDVPISWRWFLLIPAVVLLWLFSTGCAFMVARWTAITPDLDNVIPFILRILMYASGVIFSIDRFVGQFSWGWILQYQPIAVYLQLARSSLLNEPAYPVDPTMWALGAVWAAVALVVGFLLFWAGEERYGRD